MISTKAIKWNDMVCTALVEGPRTILIPDESVDEWMEWLGTYDPTMSEEELEEWGEESPPAIARMNDFDGLLVNDHGTVVGLWCDLVPLEV